MALVIGTHMADASDPPGALAHWRWPAQASRLIGALRPVAQLRVLLAKAPSVRTAESILSEFSRLRCTQFVLEHANRPQRLGEFAAEHIPLEALGLLRIYIQESSRETWRKADPSLWSNAVASIGAGLEPIERALRSELAAVSRGEDRPASRAVVGASDGSARWMEPCYRATIDAGRAGTPPATVASTIKRALAKHDLSDARVEVQESRVEVWWIPDDEGTWERDLLRGALEEGVVAAELRPDSVRIRWQRDFPLSA